jgi:hypothetical protein
VEKLKTKGIKMPARTDIHSSEVVSGANRLKYSRGYLCGAMDRAPDLGEGWRIDLQRELCDLNVYWFDPTHKPIDIGAEDAIIRAEVDALKELGLYREAGQLVKPMRAVDLRMVDLSDFLVVNIDLDVFACGTLEELTLANREKKPIIIHVEQGKEKVPNWLLAMCPHEMMFSTWPEVHTYLREVAFAPRILHYNRWMFFDYTVRREINRET